MKLCDQEIYDAFSKVATYNQWESKKNVWFDFLDGYRDTPSETGHQESKFKSVNDLGQNGVHRAHYLDEMVKLFPQEKAKFDKHLNSIKEDEESGKLIMKFHDGSSAKADAVIGCDGIKSTVRRMIVGENHPSAHPTYTHKYAYRGLVPMEKAVEAIGEERAKNACMHVSLHSMLLGLRTNHPPRWVRTHMY